MNNICYNAAEYAVEFSKLLLVTYFLFNIDYKKSLFAAFPVSFFIICFGSIFVNFSDYSILFGLAALISLFVALQNKRKIGTLCLSYICICVLDMMIGSFFLYILKIRVCDAQITEWLSILMNSALLIPICIAVVIKRKLFKRTSLDISPGSIIILIIGGISMALYISSVQFFGFESGFRTHKSIIALGLSVSSIIFIIVCALMIANQLRNSKLKAETEFNRYMLSSQEKYYKMLLKKEEETRAFRHDIKNHIYCIRTLFDEKKYDELSDYLNTMSSSLSALQPKIRTGNDIVTAVISDISDRYPNVTIQWNGILPDKLSVSSFDLCTVFSNLLNNAFEAAAKTRKKQIIVYVRLIESTLYLSVKNSSNTVKKSKNGLFSSDKTEKGHGYGMRNIRSCIEKNGGTYHAEYTDGFFVSEIVLPNAILCE